MKVGTPEYQKEHEAKVKAGLTREQATQVLADQAAHDEALAKAEAEKAKANTAPKTPAEKGDK
jgi:hypothetical protein